MDTCDQSFYVLLLCYDLTTILRSQALHQVLSLAIQYAWRSYMLSRLYRKVKTFRSDLLTYLLCVFCPFYSWFYTVLWYSPIPQTQTVSNLKWEISIHHRSIRFFIWFFVSICQKFFKMEHFDWLKNVNRVIRFFIRDTLQSKNLAYKIPE
jgi:hypothetical protein